MIMSEVVCMTLNEKIGYQMRTERLVRRMTLEDVSKKMGMSASTILRYETGKFPIPVEKLQEYCDVVGCDMLHH